jgi:hypothetical protein
LFFANQASKDYLWPVDLFIADDFDTETLFALRANREDVCKADANGDLLLRVHKILSTKSLAQQKEVTKPRNMKIWLQQAFGYVTGNPARLLVVLRWDLISEVIAYCNTRYGAANFTITWGAQAAASCLNFVSFISIFLTMKSNQVRFGLISLTHS